MDFGKYTTVLKVQRLSDEAIIPRYHSAEAAGFDLHSIDEVVLKAGERVAVRTGLAFEIDKGYEIQVRPRSGLAIKNGISVLNTPGTIDSDYRGEIMVILINLGKEDFAIHKGDRIAQAVVQRVWQVDFVEVNDLAQSERGAKGFGSSGGFGSHHNDKTHK